MKDLLGSTAYYSDEQMVHEIASWIEPWEVHADQGYVVVGVDEVDYKRLEALGLSPGDRTRADPEGNQPAPFSPLQTDGIPGYSCYRTVEETYATAETLAAAYPNLAT